MSTAICERIAPELVALLDDELGEDARRPVAEHLTSCDACRREMARLSTVRTWVTELPAIAPRATFAADFWRRLEAEPTSLATRRGAGRAIRWTIPALAAAAGLVLALRFFAPGPSASHTPIPAPGRVAAAPPLPAAPKAPAPQMAAKPATSADPARLANVEALRPEDLPPELLEHPELFLRLPVVRHLDALEHIGSAPERTAGDGGAG